MRAITQGEHKTAEACFDVKEMETVIKQASWDSMQEGRPDILQAAVRSYVEQLGHSQVIAKAGIKSRTSAYRSLKPETTPNFATLDKIRINECNALWQIDVKINTHNFFN